MRQQVVDFLHFTVLDITNTHIYCSPRSRLICHQYQAAYVVFNGKRYSYLAIIINKRLLLDKLFQSYFCKNINLPACECKYKVCGFMYCTFCTVVFGTILVFIQGIYTRLIAKHV